MSADDVATYTCQHIEALWADNFLHMVKMGMGNQPGTTAMLSIMFLSSGVTAPIALFPNNFGPLFPLLAITLITLLVNVVFWKQFKHVGKLLSNDDCGDKMSSISSMAVNDHLKHYFNLIQKQLSE